MLPLRMLRNHPQTDDFLESIPLSNTTSKVRSVVRLSKADTIAPISGCGISTILQTIQVRKKVDMARPTPTHRSAPRTKHRSEAGREKRHSEAFSSKKRSKRIAFKAV